MSAEAALPRGHITFRLMRASRCLHLFAALLAMLEVHMSLALGLWELEKVYSVEGVGRLVVE